MSRKFVGHHRLKGRGTLSNPAGRFEKETLEEVDDGWYVEEKSDSIAQTVLPDRARTVITTNDSPDVGFAASINPYRGCEHGCVYCMEGDTGVLMGDGETKALADLRAGDEIYGTRVEGGCRSYAKTQVLAHWQTRKPAYRLTLADGTTLVASADHRFLTDRGWRFVTGASHGSSRRPHLVTGDKLLGAGRSRASAPVEAPDRTKECLHESGAASLPFAFQLQTNERQHGGSSGAWARELIQGVQQLIESPQLRCEAATECAASRSSPLRHAPHLRFLLGAESSIASKPRLKVFTVESGDDLEIVSIARLRGEHDLFDITTGTGDFIANGVVSHNCFARPSHAYMGLSAGIDFETKLFYKDNAAQVLEGQLARRGYIPKPIALGINTDGYQPLERRLQVTRSILEVLARTRHPVSIITKSALVLRDIDLLAQMARDALVSVSISITSLSAEIKRTLEPRTASPQARLRTMRTLAEAGVPVGVMVAPVIPAITDHELEAILEAAAEAGATNGGYVLLRLPYELKDLFREWLAEHYPDRAAHVMSLINQARGGRDNDPNFGSRMRGTGAYAQLLQQRFDLAARKLGLNDARSRHGLATHLFRPPSGAPQMSLGFD